MTFDAAIELILKVPWTWVDEYPLVWMYSKYR